MPSSQSRRARRRHARTEGSGQLPSTAYDYSGLPNRTSIRVLELLPSPEGEIECTLDVVDLNDNPTFDALSYSWANPITIREDPVPPGEEGSETTQSILSLHNFPTASCANVMNVDPGALAFFSVHKALPYLDRDHGGDRCRSITCDGKVLKITETLFSALLQLHWIILSKKEAEEQGKTYVETLPSPRSRRIWIDQICINQENVDERSAQVPLMNKIFASAQYVFAWIGNLDSLGIAGLNTALARAHNPTRGDMPEPGDLTYESIGNMRRDLYALTALLSRQWFRRAWVCQEAIFARRLYLWAGPVFVDWWILFSALQSIDEGDITRMARFMGSLLRREPTTRLSKKLVHIRAQSNASDREATDVTNEEILCTIQGAISFMNGVVQIKKHIGLQCFNPGFKVKQPSPDSDLTLYAYNLVTGFAIADPSSRVQGMFLGSAATQQPQYLTADGPNKNWSRLSLPFTAASDTKGPISNAVVNAWFYNHSLKAMEPSPPIPISLFSLITRFRDVGASDPRDKVFAFLHLATETPGLEANYRVSVQNVFMGAARLLLDRHNLTVLSHVQDPTTTQVPNLPTWVPDFSVPLGRSPFVSHDGSSPYSAGGKATGQPTFYLTVEDKTTNTPYQIMTTFGLFLDNVVDLADTKGCYFTRTAELALKTPKFYAKSPSPLYVYKSGVFLRLADTPSMPRVEALWRTLIGDYCSKTYPAPVSAGFGFSEWVSVHAHHSVHLSSLLQDHFDAVGIEAAHEELRKLEATQDRKQDLYVKLHAEDPGAYLCMKCSQDLWNRKLQETDETYLKILTDQNLESKMAPVRYMPDADRIKALAMCARTPPPNNDSTTPDPQKGGLCPVLTPEEQGRLSAFEARMREVKTGRRMFRTKGDLLGMGPKSVQEGDEVWAILGAKVPFVLRKVDEGREPRRYQLIGEAFVLGYQDGEAVEEKRELKAIGLV